MFPSRVPVLPCYPAVYCHAPDTRQTCIFVCFSKKTQTFTFPIKCQNLFLTFNGVRKPHLMKCYVVFMMYDLFISSASTSLLMWKHGKSQGQSCSGVSAFQPEVRATEPFFFSIFTARGIFLLKCDVKATLCNFVTSE